MTALRLIYYFFYRLIATIYWLLYNFVRKVCSRRFNSKRETVSIELELNCTKICVWYAYQYKFTRVYIQNTRNITYIIYAILCAYIRLAKYFVGLSSVLHFFSNKFTWFCTLSLLIENKKKYIIMIFFKIRDILDCNTLKTVVLCSVSRPFDIAVLTYIKNLCKYLILILI